MRNRRAPVRGEREWRHGVQRTMCRVVVVLLVAIAASPSAFGQTCVIRGPATPSISRSIHTVPLSPPAAVAWFCGSEDSGGPHASRRRRPQGTSVHADTTTGERSGGVLRRRRSQERAEPKQLAAACDPRRWLTQKAPDAFAHAGRMFAPRCPFLNATQSSEWRQQIPSPMQNHPRPCGTTL